MTSPNLSEIVSSTLRKYSPRIADNVSENNPLLKRLKTRGRQKTFDGGRVIQENLEYQENDRFQWYSGYERLDPAPVDVLTAAEYPIKQAAVPVTISGLEEMQNSGGNRIFDLLEARIANAEHTMVNRLGEAIYSDGTADGGKQIQGLQLQVADSPTTGTVGGINRASWAFWRNATETISSPGSSNIISSMNKLYMATTRNGDHVDLISLDDDFYGYLWDALQAQQRFTTKTSKDMANAGFMALKFKGADVVLGGGWGGNSPSKRGYFLNTRFCSWRPHARRNMVPRDAGRPIDQDALVKYIFFGGNLCFSNLSLQGVLKT